MHSGAPLLAKKALCKLKRGTLHMYSWKNWGHVPPVPPVPMSMMRTVIMSFFFYLWNHGIVSYCFHIKGKALHIDFAMKLIIKITLQRNQLRTWSVCTGWGKTYLYKHFGRVKALFYFINLQVNGSVGGRIMQFLSFGGNAPVPLQVRPLEGPFISLNFYCASEVAPGEG